jgi:hypothetical protein
LPHFFLPWLEARTRERRIPRASREETRPSHVRAAPAAAQALQKQKTSCFMGGAKFEVVRSSNIAMHNQIQEKAYSL